MKTINGYRGPKSSLLPRLVRQAGMICHLFEQYICPGVYRANRDQELDASEWFALIDTLTPEQAGEIFDIFKTIANARTDRGLIETLDYLADYQKPKERGGDK